MLRTIVGVIIAAVVIYAWGFLYWGLGPYPKYIWKHPADGDRAGQALVQHFPERGTYFVPAAGDNADQVHARTMRKGPWPWSTCWRRRAARLSIPRSWEGASCSTSS